MSGSAHIVIVNYQTADLVSSRVMVDNDSSGGSTEKLFAAIERKDWSGWTSVMPLDRKCEFAYSNNAGIRTDFASACKHHSAFLLPNAQYPITIALWEIT